MSDCGCEPTGTDTPAQRRALTVALVLNAAMFVIESGGGLAFHSASLLADGLDMLSDAAVYALALAAIGRSALFKANAARFSGWALLLLGFGMLAEVVRRWFEGSAPEGIGMIGIAAAALVVNVVVMGLIAQQRSEEVHMRAAWIFTRADVVANAAVILSGLAVLLTGIRAFDLVVGAAIALYVMREAFEILGEAKQARGSI
ncbi:cation transporter [Altererythrobacter salegens]|uniref:Cation transporter n=1 Tax=Croceibacterium salegens TaxID=1737568 RepID=A0A6I4SYZ6_9SPHN|nr:cation transporter [Croceibacterium salegens]MXO61063.1 cation transporter [Croceibacterium salegens]